VIIYARPVFGGSGRGSIGTANGSFSEVVNDNVILKEEASGGKRACAWPHEKNSQVRDFLVTPGRDKERTTLSQAHGKLLGPG
ncbi:MAG: hypothetical protein ACREDL_05335, partial [Bradyrhizobium sp.]